MTTYPDAVGGFNRTVQTLHPLYSAGPNLSVSKIFNRYFLFRRMDCLAIRTNSIELREIRDPFADLRYTQF
jgi:hypothetical protein